MNTRSSGGPEIIKAKASVNLSTNWKAVSTVHKRPLKGQRTCEVNLANEIHTRNDYRRTSERNLKIVEAVNNSSSRYTGKHEKMEKTFRKMDQFLERHPSINSSESGDEVEKLDANPQLQAITTETTTTKTNTIFSILSAFPRESFPTVDPTSCIMSIVPRNCKIKQKKTALPELLNLKFIESQICLRSTNSSDGEDKTPRNTTKGGQNESLTTPNSSMIFMYAVISYGWTTN